MKHLTDEQIHELSPFKLHVTKSNQGIALHELDEEHLLNIIKWYLNPLLQLTNPIKAPVVADEEVQQVLNILHHNNEHHTPQSKARKIKQNVVLASPYIIEAFLRGLTEPRELLAEILHRPIEPINETVIQFDLGEGLIINPKGEKEDTPKSLGFDVGISNED